MFDVGAGQGVLPVGWVERRKTGTTEPVELGPVNHYCLRCIWVSPLLIVAQTWKCTGSVRPETVGRVSVKGIDQPVKRPSNRRKGDQNVYLDCIRGSNCTNLWRSPQFLPLDVGVVWPGGYSQTVLVGCSPKRYPSNEVDCIDQVSGPKLRCSAEYHLAE